MDAEGRAGQAKEKMPQVQTVFLYSGKMDGGQAPVAGGDCDKIKTQTDRTEEEVCHG